MEIINETNVSAGTYYKVIETASITNLILQYKLIAGQDNTIEMQVWGTVYIDADNTVDDDWVDVTQFLTDSSSVSVTDETLHDMTLLDSNCTFTKIKVKYIVTASSPSNTIKVGWNSNK